MLETGPLMDLSTNKSLIIETDEQLPEKIDIPQKKTPDADQLLMQM